MKRSVISAVILLAASLSAAAQSYIIKVSDNVPKEAAELLEQRFAQMLEGAGIAVTATTAATATTATTTTTAATATTTPQVLEVTANVVEKMTTPGAMSQTVLVVDFVARTAKLQTTRGETAAAQQTFSVKGVGKDEADAWLRAAKQVLPRSKAAGELVEKLK